jgi:hypothetical protein
MAQFKRERNRIHAKLTRDRKKLFAMRMEEMIAFLEGMFYIDQLHVCRLLLLSYCEDESDDGGDNNDDEYTNTTASLSLDPMFVSPSPPNRTEPKD